MTRSMKKPVPLTATALSRRLKGRVVAVQKPGDPDPERWPTRSRGFITRDRDWMGQTVPRSIRVLWDG